MDISAACLVLCVVIIVLLSLLLARSSRRKDSSSIESFRASSEARLEAIEKRLAELGTQNSSQMATFFRENRELGERLEQRQKQSSDAVSSVLNGIREENLRTMEAVLKSSRALTDEVGKGMEAIRKESSEQLDRMRMTVDEKLQTTLETRLSASFEQVTKNLESLYKSIGEMNRLAGDVSSLSKMFSNVKVRGTWGEVQAENILSDLMTSAQYVKNFAPRRGGPVVEFAIRLPGKDADEEVFLPIDSKFPTEDYVRYSNAVSEGDDEAVRTALRDLRARVLSEARDIRDKYIVPPKTTDFAILFVPTESPYAELLRMDGLAETLQDTYKVVLTGPTNFSALINSLQIGFKTLQVEKNTRKIWQLFRDLKAQFYRFGEDLTKTQEAIDRASDKLGNAVKRNNMISGKLGRIELPDDMDARGQLDAEWGEQKPQQIE